VHEAEDSPSALVTPRDLRRCGRAAAIELEPWPTELRPPPPDRGRSAANFSRLDAEESAAAILHREAPPRGGSRACASATPVAAALLLASSRCSAHRAAPLRPKPLLRPPRLTPLLRPPRLMLLAPARLRCVLGRRRWEPRVPL
jgi:hypothetical protein